MIMSPLVPLRESRIVTRSGDKEEELLLSDSWIRKLEHAGNTNAK